MNFVVLPYDSKRYYLKRALSLPIINDDGFFGFDFDCLDIFIRERTIGKAIEAFYEEFDFLWREYVLEDITNLSSGAIGLRERLIAYVNEVKNGSNQS